MIDKPAITSVPIESLLAQRWSPRAFNPERALTRDQLTALLEAARWAPSCAGDEPWRFLVWDRHVDGAAWQRAFDCLEPGNQEWAAHAPVLLASFSDGEFRNGKPNRWGPHDVGLATQNLLLQATALGLATHPMGGFKADDLRAAFSVPARFTAQAMIAVGHAGDPAQLSERNRPRETAARKRRPLNENFFQGAWGRGFE